MLLLLLLLTTPFLAIAAPVPYKNCGTDKDHVKIISVDVTPWPPMPEKLITGSITATLDEVITAATIEIKVKFYGAEIYHETLDACKQPNFTCPVQPGKYSQSMSDTLPKIPHGTYEFYTKGLDQKKEELFCFIVPVTIKAAPAIDQGLIDTVNNMHTTWTAGYNNKFATATREQARAMCGVLEGGPKLPAKTVIENVNVPESYDVREQWFGSCPTVKEVWDQGPCGSCWAFGGATSMTDRVCIASEGKTKVHISAGDPVACCGSCGSGCQGGYPGALWSYWKGTGIVTGGSKESGEGCLPYFFAKCDHHTTGKYPPCPAVQPTPHCPNKCQSSYPTSWSADKHFGASAYSLRGEAAFKSEIYAHGPIEVAFSVYDDFLAYKTGVYHHVSGGFLGGHAVSMYGWGTLSGTPYWIVKNSWNEDWGDNGYFLILRGKNECGIESDGCAGMPKL